MASFNSGSSAGEYTALLGGSAVGDCEFGKKLMRTILGQEISGSDTDGDTPMGYVIRGGRLEIAFNFKEWKALVVSTLYPFGGTNNYLVPPVGVDIYNYAVAMVLTAKAGTMAATTGPATVTLDKVVIAPNQPTEVIFDSRLRITPVRLICLPTDSGGVRRWGIPG